MDNRHQELLAQVASLYYEHELKQEEIAVRTGYSRSMVSRLLTEARDKGIIEIRINYPLERCLDIEDTLQQALDLRLVRVLTRGTLGDGQVLRKLGAMAANQIEELVRKGVKRIGVSWGTALWETASAVQKLNYADTRIYQVVGSSRSLDPEIDGPNLARHLAEALGGQYFTIPAPLVVENQVTRDALLHEPSVVRIMQEVTHLDLVLVGIGSLNPDASSWVRSGYLGREQVLELSRQGAVGDVCGIFFDQDGAILDTPFRNRVISISKTDLLNVPLKMGVSAGEAKIAPILAACRAGLVNCLVTDEVAALGLLQMLRSKSKKAV